jgi:hypothetical protein
MPVKEKNYIALRGIEHGNRFFTCYNENDQRDCTRLANGELAYEILGYAETVKEAQRILWPTKHDERVALLEWMDNMFQDMHHRGVGISIEGEIQSKEIMLESLERR